MERTQKPSTDRGTNSTQKRTGGDPAISRTKTRAAGTNPTQALSKETRGGTGPTQMPTAETKQTQGGHESPNKRNPSPNSNPRHRRYPGSNRRWHTSRNPWWYNNRNVPGTRPTQMPSGGDQDQEE
uniref:Btz domain-containing protein n=1 Tax=Panagrellus redivivus TaxID=6233 RepID=A0A7E4UNN0_PANRE